MLSDSPSLCTAFDGDRRLVTGSLLVVALAVKRALEAGATGPVLIFDDANGRAIDLDTRESEPALLRRLAGNECAAAAPDTAEPPRGRGRPRLGVVAREVTLLPRHWDWLSAQPGGASVALRKLVEQARRDAGDRDRTRQAHERAYHFMSAMAGDRPGFEDATRALFAGDGPRFDELIAAWPADIRDHARRLTSDADEAAT